MDERAIEEHMEQVLPQVLVLLDVTTILLAHLVAMGTLDEYTKQQVNAEKTNIDKVNRLMAHIKRDLTNRFRPLLESLRQTNQLKVLHILTLPRSKLDDKETLDNDLKQCSVMLAEAYKKYGEGFSIFKNKPGFQSFTVQLGEVFTNLRLMTTKKDRTSTGVESESLDLAQAFKGTPRTTLFVGYPGCGKSSVILYLAILWADLILGGDNIEEVSKVPSILKDIKLLIYLRPQDYGDDLVSSVINKLQICCGSYSSTAIRYFREMESVGIVLDSLDEIDNWKSSRLKSDIVEMMLRNRSLVIGGVRRGHPVLDSLYGQHQIRFLQIDGFDEESIFKFIYNFFHFVVKNEDLYRSFQKAVESDLRLRGLLVHPLTSTMLCFLLSEKEIKIDDLKDVTTIQIYAKLEELVSIRDRKRSSKRFNKVAFLKLAANEAIFEEDLKDVGIDPAEVPFINLGNCSLGNPQKGRQILFPHKSFEEFAASKFLLDCDPKRQLEILSYLATQRASYNILELIIQSIELGQKELEIVLNIVLFALTNASSEESGFSLHAVKCKNKSNNKICNKLCQLAVMDVLEGGLDDSLMEKMRKVKPCTTCWEKSPVHGVTDWRESENLDTAVKLIHAIPETTKQLTVFENTIGRVLSKRLRCEARTMIHVPGTTRCTSIFETSPGCIIYIQASRPSDIIEGKLISLMGSRRPEVLWLYPDHDGGIMGPSYTATYTDWEETLQHILHQGPQFQGQGKICVSYLSHNTNINPLLTALPCKLQLLCQQGVKNIVLWYGNVPSGQLVTWVQNIRQNGWTTTAGSGYLLITRTVPEKLEMKIEIIGTDILSQNHHEQDNNKYIVDDLNMCVGVKWKVQE